MATNISYVSSLVYTGEGEPTNGDDLALDNTTYPLDCIYVDSLTGNSYTRTGENLTVADWPLNYPQKTPCLIYRALLIQVGSGNPVPIVMRNTIGNILWTRNSQGIYFGTLTNGFKLNKTFVSVTCQNRNALTVGADYANDSVVRYFTNDDAWNPVDGENVFIEIKVHPY